MGRTGVRGAVVRSLQAGFTLLELILVVAVIGLVVSLISIRSGTFDYWKEESAIRKLSETLVLLHNQAVMDQAFYRIEFDLKEGSYRVGVMRSEADVAQNQTGFNLPILTLELAALLSPSMSGESTMIPPPSYPSLAVPSLLPSTLAFRDIGTPRGTVQRDDNSENPFLIFSPRGFSEFGVIHLITSDERQVTILVNPWTGLAEVYREYKEFQWNLGKKK
jgi:prepilin-type N-terminal cleavage/methylation domain-containing protein